MKRRIKTERIIILLLSVIVILQSVFLIIVLCTSKKESICTSEKKNDLANMNEVVCGDDSDIARFMCVRYRESGYVITFKEKVDDNAKHNVLSRLMSSLSGTPAMYVDKMEINNFLRNAYGIQTEKDFGIDSFIYVPNYGNLEEERLKQTVKNIKELDKVITFKVSK